MKISGERILIFGDSLSHNGGDLEGEIWDLDGSSPTPNAPGALLAYALLQQGAEAVRIDANVGRSAYNFWNGGARWQLHSAQDLIASDQAFAPTKVIVFLGTNDLGLDAAADGNAFQAIKDSFPSADFIAIGPPIFADPTLNAQADTVYDTLQTTFGRSNVIDSRPLSSTEGRTKDGIHFGADAAQSFAAGLVDAVGKTGGFQLWMAVGLGALGIGALIGTGIFMNKRHEAKALLGAPSDEDEDDEPLTEHDYQVAARFDMKRFGLTFDEAMALVKLPNYRDTLRDIDEWRAKHGFPAQNSPLSRGYVLSKIGKRKALRGPTYFDFSKGELYADGDEPFTQAQVDSIWNSKTFPTTGAMWVEHGHLFVQQYDGAKAYDLGPVEAGVKGARHS